MKPSKTLIFFTVTILLVLTYIITNNSFTGEKDICLNPRIIDGDTLKCSQYAQSIRIIPSYTHPNMWFDTPETSLRHADCPEEITLGKQSKLSLQQLSQNDTLFLVHPDPNSLTTDHFGRILSQVMVESTNQNIAHLLTHQNLGVIYHKSKHPHNWCK